MLLVIEPKFMVFTYHNNQRYYLLKDGSLALLNAVSFDKYRSYKRKSNARKIALNLTRNCGYRQQFSVIQVFFNKIP